MKTLKFVCSDPWVYMNNKKMKKHDKQYGY